MDLSVEAEEKVAVKYLRAECGVRYWEDAHVNGDEDVNGDLIPCRSGEAWCPLIDLEAGAIVDWPKGTVAEVHYKVCDDGRYTLLDAHMTPIKTIDGYVPKIMCPGGDGWGDYIIMSVDGDGRIADWHATLDAFED